MQTKERKCIAVIISKPERRYQSGLLRGISKAAFEKDMNIAVFATSLLQGMDEYIQGEQNIYNLINFERFAGVIYAIGSFYGNSITASLNQKLLEINSKGIPVIAIDGEVEGLPSYFNNDANAVEDVLSHLIEVHGIKDIAYMTGHKGHLHAENSLTSYRNTMSNFQLDVPESRVYYGNYWTDSAPVFVEQLLNSPEGLPEAIVCANEHMAIGLYQELYRRGIYMPTDIKLACTSNDSRNAPYLLSGENNLENVGFEACMALFRALEGDFPVPKVKFFPCKNHLKTGIGCGCQKVSSYDYSKERGILIESESGYFGEANFSKETILFQKDFHSLFDALNNYTDYIKGFQSIYLCLCEDWDNPYFLINDTKNNPYTERMQLCYYRKEHEQAPEITINDNLYFPSELMLPDLFQAEGEPSFFVFRALHFLDRNYGYIVINSGQSPEVYGMTYNFWLQDVSNALESQCRLQSVNYMFYTDIMTGLYNRNGFNTMLPDICRDAVEAGKQVLFLLADLNYLKSVNDTYGHTEGDAAITAAARLLKHQTLSDVLYEKNFRIGGDEFVKIAIGDFTEEAIHQFRRDFYTSVATYSNTSGKPYKTEISLGYSFGSVSKKEEMEQLLSIADKRMYQEKQLLKSRSGL